MLAALGPRLQWLSVQGYARYNVTVQRSVCNLVPAVLRNCPLLVHLGVENLLASKAETVCNCQHPSMVGASHDETPLKCCFAIGACRSGLRWLQVPLHDNRVTLDAGT